MKLSKLSHKRIKRNNIGKIKESISIRVDDMREYINADYSNIRNSML